MIPLLVGMGAAMAGSAGSTLLGHHLGQASAEQQQRAQINAYKNRHLWEVADLKNAGLNPMLSANGGGGSVGGMAQAQVPQSDAGRAVSDGLQGASARAVARAQVDNLRADTALKTEGAYKTRQEGARALWEAGSAFHRSQIDKMESDAMAKDPDALWRTRYQGPLMRKIDDVSASAKQLWNNHIATPKQLTPEQKKVLEKMKDVPPPW